jgi:coproporphyrinogen III oxidase-like Fe-S oxidoreductase
VRLALFGYAHVPWFKPHQRLIDEAMLPCADGRIAQKHAAAETLDECGYAPIGLDHLLCLATSCRAPHGPAGCTAIFKAIRQIRRMR